MEMLERMRTEVRVSKKAPIKVNISTVLSWDKDTKDFSVEEDKDEIRFIHYSLLKENFSEEDFSTNEEETYEFAIEKIDKKISFLLVATEEIEACKQKYSFKEGV